MKPSQSRDVVRRLEAHCRAHGLPLTVQRRAVLEALWTCGSHPTVEDVHAAVGRDLPSVSRTTVYRVLEMFVRIGTARKIWLSGTTARFDPVTEPHHHLACLRCNALIDIADSSLSRLKTASARRLGFEVADYVIHFRGICAACRRAGKAASPGRDRAH